MAQSQSLNTVKERLEARRQAHNAYDVYKIMEFFVEDGLDYSEYGTNQLHLPYNVVRGSFTGLSNSMADLVVTTRNISGTDAFVAWEMDAEGTYVKDFEFPGWPKAEGQKFSLTGVCLIWLTPAGKIEKEGNYASMWLTGKDGVKTKI